MGSIKSLLELKPTCIIPKLRRVNNDGQMQRSDMIVRTAVVPLSLIGVFRENLRSLLSSKEEKPSFSLGKAILINLMRIFFFEEGDTAWLFAQDINYMMRPCTDLINNVAECCWGPLNGEGLALGVSCVNLKRMTHIYSTRWSQRQ